MIKELGGKLDIVLGGDRCLIQSHLQVASDIFPNMPRRPYNTPFLSFFLNDFLTQQYVTRILLGNMSIAPNRVQFISEVSHHTPKSLNNYSVFFCGGM